jgi:acetyltransferase-like isoleucine patch superfamily enzyme
VKIEPESVAAFDKASHRNRGGLLQKLVTKYKLHRYVTKFGSGILIRPSARMRVTDGGVLEFGNNCTVQDYAYFQLTKPHPYVSVGNNTVIGRGCIITAKNKLIIGANVLMGSFVQVIDHGHGLKEIL